jgi:hypothetical protein
MLDDNDKPIRDGRGVLKRTLEPGEDAAAVARKLTRDIHMRQADSDGFHRDLRPYYDDTGWR